MYWQHNNQTRQGCERKMCENSMVEAWRVESGRGKLLGEGAASPLPMHSYGVWGISPPAGSGAEPQPKWNLVHFGLKIWHLVTTILMIFMRNFTYKNALDISVGEHEWVKWKCASLTQDAWALACLNNLIVNDVNYAAKWPLSCCAITGTLMKQHSATNGYKVLLKCTVPINNIKHTTQVRTISRRHYSVMKNSSNTASNACNTPGHTRLNLSVNLIYAQCTHNCLLASAPL